MKELRLRGIDDIQSANAFLPEFITDYNQRFSVAPKTPQNAHRKMLHDSAALDLILSLHTPRKLSRNLTCRYRSREYQIQGQGHGYRLRGSTVTVCESFDGPISLLCQGKTLDYRVLAQGQPPIPTDDEKSLCRTVDKARSLQRKRPRYKPSPDHPWNPLGSSPPSPFLPYPIATPVSSPSSRLCQNPIRRGNGPRNRHSRESGNPGVVEGCYSGVSPAPHPPGFPLSRE